MRKTMLLKLNDMDTCNGVSKEVSYANPEGKPATSDRRLDKQCQVSQKPPGQAQEQLELLAIKD